MYHFYYCSLKIGLSLCLLTTEICNVLVVFGFTLLGASYICGFGSFIKLNSFVNSFDSCSW